jgi:RNA-binding protein
LQGFYLTLGEDERLMGNIRVLGLTLSTLSHATEDSNKVLEAIGLICPPEVASESTSERVRGHYGNEILILNKRVFSPVQANRCFVELWHRLNNSDRELIRTRLADFTDSSGTLFLRIDKEESYQGNVILGGPETIKMTVRFGGHNMAREPMLSNITNWMETIDDQSRASPTMTLTGTNNAFSQVPKGQ